MRDRGLLRRRNTGTRAGRRWLAPGATGPLRRDRRHR